MEGSFGAFFYLYFKTEDMTGEQTSVLLKRISINPEILGGKPIIRDLRFGVSDILDLLAEGMTQSEIMADFPFLEPEDISAALLYASMRMTNTRIIHAA